MSTLQATNLKHASSASNNVVLDASGNAAIAGNLSFNSGFGSAGVAYGCRAWVNFNGTGTVAIRASGNVSSITDNGQGDYTVNFTTAMSDANYSAVGMASNFDGGTDRNVSIMFRTVSGANPTTTALRLKLGTTNTTTGVIDPDIVAVSVFR